MTGPAIYQAAETGQMREAGAVSGFVLEIHELRDDGQPRCGPKPDSWRGNPMSLVKLCRGWVTCRRCAGITGH
jgi:hypothetical protein